MCGCWCICLWKCEVITSWTAWPNTCWLYHGNYHYWIVLKQHQVCCYFVFGWGWVGHLLWVVYTAQCIKLENVALLEWSIIVVVSFHCELKGSGPTAVKDTLFLLFIHLWVSLDVMCQPSWSQMGKYDCHCLSYSQMSLLVLLTDGSTWRQRMYKRTKPSWKI